MGELNLRNTVILLVVFLAAVTVASSAQKLKTIHDFEKSDGSYPQYTLVQGLDGNIYGTTWNYFVGVYYGYGTFFKMSPSGTVTSLYDFCSQTNCTDGAWPFGVTLGTDGNFYGVTNQGGLYNSCGGAFVLPSCGTVFKITPAGQLTVLYNFCAEAQCLDGAIPEWGLVQGTDGNFYGVTVWGGEYTQNCYNGCGTVFKVTPSGKLTTLHSFSGHDGFNPYGGLIQASDGNFYGTTGFGGLSGNNCQGGGGCGTIFRITPGGQFTKLYDFCMQEGCPDGHYPISALVQAADGSIYGTAFAGGNDWSGCMVWGCGTIFKITLGGKFTTLYSFCSQSGCADGGNSTALIQATDGKLYGVTQVGGEVSYNGVEYGTVFSFTTAGKLTTLFDFVCNAQSLCPNGNSPQGELVQTTNGMFYGTTIVGGDLNSPCVDQCGTVFSLSMGLGPFVETDPAAGKVGRKVFILGNNLKGTTSVAFNGAAAEFKVVSGHEIRTSVPTGATTGFVTVTTPKGNLQSNVVFRVTQ